LPGSARAIRTPAPIDIAGDTAKPRFRFRTVCKNFARVRAACRRSNERGRLTPNGDNLIFFPVL
jgi:hypothetical protein